MMTISEYTIKIIIISVIKDIMEAWQFPCHSTLFSCTSLEMPVIWLCPPLSS